ncbi:ferrochelatase [Litorivivens lipolytica]|uniref:Ferrochelatase n=1 Tax=Litorivivens lipolytica TaxID=1524264 RepID=A0A7W4W235_9GAMM|nr:ferrochelatase [Litorivivens lipolytica]MBB3046012.1 ferrochelatase [Litorivivens lipolytica]
MSGKAVILINLGTPDNPDSAGVRAFLKDFLSDRRVVEVPRPIWWLILNLIILPFRSPKVAKKYQPLWAMGDSPLRLFSQRLVAGIQEKLGQDIAVELAMTYGKPGLVEVIEELEAKGAKEFYFVPLYPQYSATTTAAAMDAVARYFMGRRDIPQWSWLRNYHDEQAYIEALADSVRAHWQTHGQSDRLLMSFHGIPKRNVDLGDPYQQHCQETAESLAKALGLNSDQWLMTYQSRLGKAEWLQPYTDKTVAELAKSGVKSVDVIAPSFAADCLETLEELDTEAAEIFYENGGESFSYIPCLNDSEKHVGFFTDIIKRKLSSH